MLKRSSFVFVLLCMPMVFVGAHAEGEVVVPNHLVEVCVDVGTDSYLLHDVIGAGSLDGHYEAWCADVDGGIGVGCFDAHLVSSLDGANNAVISAPGNWDLINYLLNGIESYRGLGAGRMDFQWVMWRLSDPGLEPPEIPDNPGLAQLILDDVTASGEGFVPGPGQLVGVAVVHADPLWQETVFAVRCDDPPTECDACHGKVTDLTLRYDGPGPAHVTVDQKKDSDRIFDGIVDTGDTFSFSGTDKNGTMGTEILVSADGQVTKIHTSCSQPIGVGFSFGPYTVVAGRSKDGGDFCPDDPPPPPPPPPPPSDCGPCKGKVTQLTLRYAGSGDFITVEQKKDGRVIFDGFVGSGETFELVGADKNGTMGTDILVTVAGELTKIHTSCSQPIGPGMVFGPFTVISGYSRDGGLLCE